MEENVWSKDHFVVLLQQLAEQAHSPEIRVDLLKLIARVRGWWDKPSKAS